MRPAYRADEAKSPLLFLPGNHLAWSFTAMRLLHRLPSKRFLRWLPALALLAFLNSSAQTVQLLTTAEIEGSGPPDATPLPDSPGAI